MAHFRNLLEHSSEILARWIYEKYKTVFKILSISQTARNECMPTEFELLANNI